MESELQSFKPSFEPIAIVGVGGLFPQAEEVRAYWAMLKTGQDAITEIPPTHWRISDYFDADPKKPDHTYAKRGGFLRPFAFDPLAYGITPNALEATDTSQLLAMVAAQDALRDAGYNQEGTVDRDRVSVILGVTGALELVIPLGARLGHPRWRKALEDSGIPEDIAKEVVERISASYPPWSEASFPGLLGNVVAGRVANRLDLGGTNCVVDAACASSLSALHLACLELQAGHADLVLSGGVDTFNDIFMYMCFSKTPALSPTGDARPFDAEGDGTILGEGVGMVALKRLADAQRDGDRVYAVIKGIGSSSDGRGRAIYAPSDAGQAKALRRAYERAGVDARSIELVEAHGTGTKVGDATEIKALVEVFGQAELGQPPWCALGSVKSQIGHTKAAAGVSGLIKIALALHRKVLLPSIKARKPLPILRQERTPLYLNNALRPWLSSSDSPRRAALSALGFGGSNFHCVLEEADPHLPASPDWDGRVQILAFCADTPAQIEKALSAWEIPQGWLQLCAQAIQQRAAFRSDAPHRLLWACEAHTPPERWGALRDAALQALGRFEKQAAMSPDKAGVWTTPEGISYGRGPRSGKLAVIIPGQGCQYTGMLRDLVCHFPESFGVLERAQQAWRKHSTHATPLDRLIYPIPAWDDAERLSQDDALRSTDVAQPALGAVSLAAARALARFGVQADLLAGHSYGELVALHLAGAYDEETLFAISHKRGQLMAQGGDRGTMLAVQAPLAQIEAFVREEAPDLVIANQNSPTQAVLSGTFAAIAAAEPRLESRKMRTRRIPVAAAFHSPLVSDAQAPFGECLSSMVWSSTHTPVFANKTAAPYPYEPQSSASLLAAQLASPVRFVEQISAMADAGARIFLELGPGYRMTRLIESILAKNEGVDAFSLDASQGQRDGLRDLALTLARLAAHGYPVRLAEWDTTATTRPSEHSKKPTMQVMISGANVFTSQRAIPPSPARLETPTTPTTLSPNPPKPPMPPMSPSPARLESPTTPTTLSPKIRMPPSSARIESPTPTASLISRTKEPSASQSEPSKPSASSATKPILSNAMQATPTNASIPRSPYANTQRTPIEPHRSRSVFSPPIQGSRTMSDDLLHTNQQMLYQLLHLQQQTAQLHQQFLEGQQQARQVFYQMWLQQHGISPPSTDISWPASPQPPLPAALYAPTPSASIAPSAYFAPPASYAPTTSASYAPTASASYAPASSAVVPLSSASSVVSRQPAPVVSAPAPSAVMRQPSAPSVYGSSAAISSVPTSFRGNGSGHHTNGDTHSNGDSLHSSAPTVLSTPSFVAHPQAASKQPKGSSVADSSALSGLLFRVVSEKTGYPMDILDASMELDADLGIDSIKRVEILSSLQEAQPSLPHLSSQDLGTLRTLGDIVDALAKMTRQDPPIASPDTARSTASFSTPSATSTSSTSSTSPTALGSSELSALSGLLFRVVSEKTGYPMDILDASMELDADLGIDSIKRVEILSALQEAQPSLPHLSSQALGSLRTLGDIVGALMETLQTNGGPPTMATHEGGPPADPSFGADLTRWPAQLQRLTLQTTPFSLSAAASVSLAKEGPLYLASDDFGLAEKIAAFAQTQGFFPQVLSVAELPEVLEAQAVLRGVILVAPFREVPDSFGALAVAKAAATRLQSSATQGGSLFATISRMDGAFGLGQGRLDPPSAVDSGALAGLTKTAAREWPQVHCRALDIAPEIGAETAIHEIWAALCAIGPVEIAGSIDGWCTLSLQPSVLSPISFPSLEPSAALTDADLLESLPIQRGDLVIVTGGARGVTATVAQALAQACQPTLLLLGRSPLPEPEASWLQGLDDEASIKKALLQHTQGKPTPRDIQRRCEDILRGREVHRTLAALRRFGSKVLYRSLDIADSSAVRAVLESVQAEEGPVRGIIHGAGILADRRIAEKRLADAEKVYATKVQGFLGLLGAVDESALRCVVLFSSSTARFGRIGQADYAMANEALNKIAQRLHRRLPNCVVRSMNWGPWDGGMVTPALKQIFAREGVGVIGLEEGARCMLQELSSKMAAVRLLEPSFASAPSNQPSDQPLTPSSQTRQEDIEVVILGTIDADGWVGWQRTLTMQQDLFLRDHQMRGVGVLPAAIMVEWMAVAAHTVLSKQHPNASLRWLRMEGMEVRKGCSLTQEAVPLRWIIRDIDAVDGAIRLAAVCESPSPAKTQTYASARLLFGPQQPIPSPSQRALPKGALSFFPYDRLFHGPLFHCIESVDGCDATGICARLKAAASPASWMEQPPRQDWWIDPYWLDGAFQMIILWSLQQHGFPCLPTGFARMDIFRTWRPEQLCEVRVWMQPSSLPVLMADIEVLDLQGALILRIESARSIADPSLVDTFRSSQESRS